MRTLCCLVVALAALPSLQGCSEGPIKTVPVYGTITFADREPPATTDIIFQPVKVEGPLRPSFADVEPDGSYRIKAFKNSKGLIPGTYHVLLTLHDLKKPGANPKLESNWKTIDYDAGEVEVPVDSGGVEHDIEVRTKR